MSHLASGRDGSKLFFPGLFVLFAFLEESLRDLDILDDQRMSFRSRSCGLAVFTVALGTLNQQQGHQHPGGKLGDSSENVRRRWGHYEYRILRPVMSDREGIGEWLAGNCRLSSIVLTHISRAPRTSHVTRTAKVLSYDIDRRLGSEQYY